MSGMLLSGFVEQQNFNAAIFSPPGLGIVRIAGVVGAVALYRETGLGDAIAGAENLQQIYAAGGGQLPITLEAFVVNGDGIGMSDQRDLVRNAREYFSYS